MVVNRPAHDGFNREGTELNFNGDQNAIDHGAHIGPDAAKRSFQNDIADAGCLMQSLENFKFALPVRVAFTLKEFARNRIDVGKVVHPVSAGFENHFLAAIETDERPVPF